MRKFKSWCQILHLCLFCDDASVSGRNHVFSVGGMRLAQLYHVAPMMSSATTTAWPF